MISQTHSNTISYTIYPHFADVPRQEWNEVVNDPSDLAMDLRLLDAFERTMSAQCQCWAVIFRDEAEKPIAAAAMCLFTVDGLDSTGPAVQKFAAAVRKAWRGFMKFRVLFCGLPVPSGANHLRIAQGIEAAPVVRALDRLMRKHAKRVKAKMLVWKELDEAAEGRFAALGELGYLRGPIPPVHLLNRRFESFEAYLAALQSGYRKQILRSVRKFDTFDATVEHWPGAKIAEQFTDEMHALYAAVWKRSEYRLEFFPAEFFREVGRVFGDDVNLTTVRIKGRLVGFSFGLMSGPAGNRVYNNMYVGLDYAANAEADVYFNLYYRDLDRVFKAGASAVQMGQTSDDFKVRLGSEQPRLVFYTRSRNAVMRLIMRAFSKWVFPLVKTSAPRDVFKAPAVIKPLPNLQTPVETAWAGPYNASKPN